MQLLSLILSSLLFALGTAYVPIVPSGTPFLGKKTSNPNDDKDVNKSNSIPTPQDLENAYSEAMWKMKVIQKDPEFLATRPESLQTLFQACQDSVQVAPSSIPAAGKGLFAIQDISAGSIFTFYPVHAMGVNFEDGSCFLHGRDGYDHTKSAYIMSLVGNRPILNIDLKHDFNGMGFVDADPNRSVEKAWQCHFINDGAIVQKNTPESVMEYYVDSLKKQNAMFLPVGPAPLVAAIATKDIPEGQEIFTCYGSSYWLGLVESDTDLWCPRTKDMVLTEQKIASVLEEATDYMSETYAQEEAELQQAFNDIA